MARAFILSHGQRQPGDGETFVPTGRTIAFYSNYDENTDRAIGLAAVNAGDVQPIETFSAGETVTNYRLSAFSDSEMAEHLAAESSRTDATPYFVGGELPNPSLLCTTPAQCALTKPLHDDRCQGVFRHIAEADIFSVSCRGAHGGAASTLTMDGSTDFADETEKMPADIRKRLSDDEAAGIAYWESLTDATRVMIRGADMGLQPLIDAYYQGGGASTPAAVLEARRYLEAYGDGTFYSWVITLEDRQQAMIRGDAALEEAFQRGWAEVNPRDKLLDGAEEVTPSPVAVLAARIGEIAAAIGEAVAQFAGDETDDLSAVGEAYGALMGEVQAYQGTVTGDGAATAASLYDAGAAVGVELAQHQEQHDADSLARLRSAVEVFGQWAASLG